MKSGASLGASKSLKISPAVGAKIREVARLRKLYGKGRWRKVKGVATVELVTGEVRVAELHWYEAHGIGKKQIKVKRLLD